MNGADFSTWWDDFETRFKSKAAWAMADGEGMVRSWADILQPCELIDALAANKAFQRDDAQWPNDWEKIPVAVRDLSASLRAKRLAAAYRTQHAPGGVSSHGPCGLCDGYGLVLREDDHRRVIGYACPCQRGDHWIKPKRMQDGRTRVLPRFQPAARYSEFDEFNACESF